MTQKEIGNLYSIVALSMLFLILCLMLIFYIRSRFLLNLYRKTKWVKPVCEIVFGSILGAFALFFFYYIEQFNANINYSLINFLLFSVICFPLIYYSSPYASASFTLVSFFIWCSYLDDFTHKSMYMILFGMISFQVFGLFFNLFKNKILKFSGALDSVLFLLLITVSVPNYRNEIMFYIVLGNLLLFSYVYIFVAKYLNDFFYQTIQIKEKITYENKYFINANYSKNKFYDFIKENKISFGYFIMIDFNESNVDYIETLYSSICKQFNEKQIILFKTSQNNFCMFIKKDFTNNNKIWLEKKLHKILIDIENINKRINFLISIYGMNSNLYDELAMQCRSMVSLDVNSKILFFDNLKNNINLLEKQEVKKLYSQIKFNSISIDFVPIKINDKDFVYPKIKYPLEMHESELFKKYQSNINLIRRIISNIIVYRFNYSNWKDKANLILPYPSEALSSSDFKVDKFINTFINNFGKNMISKILIVFNDADLKNKNLISNIEYLKTKNIKFGTCEKAQNNNKLFDYYLQ